MIGYGPLALGLAVIPMAVAGFTGAGDGDMAERRAAFKADHEAVHAAIEAEDYAAWHTAVTNAAHSPFAEHATEETFASLVEIHDARENDDRETARELTDELFTSLDIEKPEHTGMHGKHGRFIHAQMSDEDRAALRESIEAGDYTSWLSIMTKYVPEDHQTRLTEEKFERISSRPAPQERGEREGSRPRFFRGIPQPVQ